MSDWLTVVLAGAVAAAVAGLVSLLTARTESRDRKAVLQLERDRLEHEVARFHLESQEVRKNVDIPTRRRLAIYEANEVLEAFHDHFDRMHHEFNVEVTRGRMTIRKPWEDATPAPLDGESWVDLVAGLMRPRLNKLDAELHFCGYQDLSARLTEVWIAVMTTATVLDWVLDNPGNREHVSPTDDFRKAYPKARDLARSHLLALGRGDGWPSEEPTAIRPPEIGPAAGD